MRVKGLEYATFGTDCITGIVITYLLSHGLTQSLFFHSSNTSVFMA
jgi:hypothetical protein